MSQYELTFHLDDYPEEQADELFQRASIIADCLGLRTTQLRVLVSGRQEIHIKYPPNYLSAEEASFARHLGKALITKAHTSEDGPYAEKDLGKMMQDMPNSVRDAIDFLANRVGDLEAQMDSSADPEILRAIRLYSDVSKRVERIEGRIDQLD